MAWVTDVAENNLFERERSVAFGELSLPSQHDQMSENGMMDTPNTEIKEGMKVNVNVLVTWRAPARMTSSPVGFGETLFVEEKRNCEGYEKPVICQWSYGFEA